MPTRSARSLVGDPTSDALAVEGHQDAGVPAGQRRPLLRGKRGRRSSYIHAERVAGARDRDAAALLLHQAALLREAAAADRELAALARHEAALDRAAADSDELTGAQRRRSGLPALQREIDRCRRVGSALVLGFVDVDGLKAINDDHGHLAGDLVLRAVSAHLQASLRAYDVVVRFGGDEFVYSVAGAGRRIAEARFADVIASLADAAPGHSATAGFAELRPEDTLETLIARADADMYRRRRPGNLAASPPPGGRNLDASAHPTSQ